MYNTPCVSVRPPPMIVKEYPFILLVRRVCYSSRLPQVATWMKKKNNDSVKNSRLFADSVLSEVFIEQVNDLHRCVLEIEDYSSRKEK